MADAPDLENASAREIVRIYNDILWNEKRTDLVEKICANPMVRHDPNKSSSLTHQEQIQRIESLWPQKRPKFDPRILAGDDTYVTLVWDMTSRNSDDKLCGIEVFKVVNGKITDVWNSGYYPGRWG